MRSYLLVEVVHTKPISDLADVVAGRVWTLEKVQAASAMLINSHVAFQIAMAQKEGSHHG